MIPAAGEEHDGWLRAPGGEGQGRRKGQSLAKTLCHPAPAHRAGGQAASRLTVLIPTALYQLSVSVAFFQY